MTLNCDANCELNRQRLTKDKLVAPCYFILGGRQAGEGCGLSPARDRTVDTWELGSVPEHPWYLLETNYDHWEPAPFFDDRRDAGDFCMDQMGEAVCSQK